MSVPHAVPATGVRKEKVTKGVRMLVLTRKAGQSIVIGDGIEVTVLSVAGDKVRIGVEADRDIPIYRDEVHRRIAAEGKAERNGNGKVESKP
jgi:carbon storage regulator CsrA